MICKKYLTVNDWCKEWNMNINMSKTKVLEIRKKGTERSLAKFRLGDSVISKCTDYKYLGVYIDEFLEFKKNVDVLEASGQRGLGALIAKLQYFGDMGYHTFTKCFYTSIAPITEYGSEVWGFIKHPKLECVQQKAMRIFLGVHKYAANEFLNGDMGWHLAKVRLKVNMLR